MRTVITQTNFPVKLGTFPCLTNILLQATAGTGTLVKIEKDKQALDQNVVPVIGLTIDPANNIYSFCWKGEMWAKAVGGTMFVDLIENVGP